MWRYKRAHIEDIKLDYILNKVGIVVPGNLFRDDNKGWKCSKCDTVFFPERGPKICPKCGNIDTEPISGYGLLGLPEIKPRKSQSLDFRRQRRFGTCVNPYCPNYRKSFYGELGRCKICKERLKLPNKT